MGERVGVRDTSGEGAVGDTGGGASATWEGEGIPEGRGG